MGFLFDSSPLETFHKQVSVYGSDSIGELVKLYVEP